MPSPSRVTGPFCALLLLLAGAASAQAPKSVLEPVVPRVKAVVRQAQPRASFGASGDFFLGQFHTVNYTIQPRDGAGHKLPSHQELGPMRGGFYLQLQVIPGTVNAPPQTTPFSAARPWDTVTTYYPLPAGRTIVMTWEAAHGAPKGLAAKVGQLLSSYAASL